MKKKVLVSCATVRDIGGISSSLLNLLNIISGKYDVTLCVLTGNISPKVHIPDNITVIKPSKMFRWCFSDFEVLRQLSFFEKLVMLFWRVLRKAIGTKRMIPLVLSRVSLNDTFDTALAFCNDLYDNGRQVIGGDYYFVANRVESHLKIAYIHNDVRQLGFTPELCGQMYEKFDFVANVSYACKDIYDEMMPEHKVSKSVVLYNMYNIASIKEGADDYDAQLDASKLNFVTVCRLVEQQKKVSRVLKTCKRLKDEGISNFKWTVVGYGPDEEYYLRLVKEYNISDVIEFTGLKKNPYPYMKSADVFVLPSLYEGLSMTMCEALIVGTPVLATCFKASEEVVTDGRNGMLCANSSDGVYCAVKKIIENPELLKEWKRYVLNNPVTNDEALHQFESICIKGIRVV